MKDAAQQVVAQAGNVLDDGEGGPRRIPDGVGKGRVGRAGLHGGASGFKDGLVVQGQYEVPGVAEGADGVVGFQAEVRHCRGPGVGERRRRIATGIQIGAHTGQMAVEAGMEHYSGGDDQQGALGGLVPARAVAAGFGRGQVQGLGQQALLGIGKAAHGFVQAAGQGGGGVVGVAQLRRRQPDDRYQLLQVAG